MALTNSPPTPEPLPADSAQATEGSAVESCRDYWLARLAGAILFYTRLPLPRWWLPSWDGIAAFAPAIGLGIGGVLACGDWGLHHLGMPPLTRSALLVAVWGWLTAGLHLDGAMDTADGLAVPDGQRRLVVMADSHTGAFGAMVAVAILGLKTAALTDMAVGRSIILLLVPGLGRWGQVMAIACYPYLKATGKGAFHKTSLRLPQDVLLGLVAIALVGGGWAWWHPEQRLLVVSTVATGLLMAIVTGWWVTQRLGGHTGDTYGAVVEWTETLTLCLATIWAS
jgi:adenosylcobinamide-GDP ribazoletransferase